MGVHSVRFTYSMSYLTKADTHHDRQVTAARKATLQELSVEEVESAIAVGTTLGKNMVRHKRKTPIQGLKQ
jgi:hypothetical protein